MTVGHRLQDLLDNGSCFFFREDNFGDDLIEKLSSFAEFSNQVVPLIILEDFVQLQNIWMIKPLEDGAFLLELFFFLLGHGLFFDKFNCPDVLRVSGEAFSHITESALSQHLTNLVMVLEFAVVGLDKVRLANFQISYVLDLHLACNKLLLSFGLL
jgi:hypothetical protein